jgi:hypothetical protein
MRLLITRFAPVVLCLTLLAPASSQANSPGNTICTAGYTSRSITLSLHSTATQSVKLKKGRYYFPPVESIGNHSLIVCIKSNKSFGQQLTSKMGIFWIVLAIVLIAAFLTITGKPLQRRL